MVKVTESAQEYLAELLSKQEVEGIAVRIFILDAGTPRAETCISFCRPGEEKADDEEKVYKDFNAFIERASIPFLEDAVVDFQKDSMGGQLTIKAPNSRMPKLQTIALSKIALIMCCITRLTQVWHPTAGMYL